MLDMFVTSGPDFPPDFDPAAVDLESWGQLRMNFENESLGTIAWQSSLPEFPSFGTQPMTKLGSVSASAAGCRSGSYFNADQSGHGIVAQILNVGGEDQILLTWYVYQGGEQIWLLGQAPFEGTTATIPMNRFSGGEFPPAFSADQVVSAPWGSIEITFPDAASAEIQWESDDPEFGSGALVMRRLTTLAGHACP